MSNVTDTSQWPAQERSAYSAGWADRERTMSVCRYPECNCPVSVSFAMDGTVPPLALCPYSPVGKTHGRTGNIRYIEVKRWFRSSLIVLQVEESYMYTENIGGRYIECETKTRWRNATVADLPILREP